MKSHRPHALACTNQDCFPDGYTPITASTAMALGNLLAKQGAKAGGGALVEPHTDSSPTRKVI